MAVAMVADISRAFLQISTLAEIVEAALLARLQ